LFPLSGSMQQEPTITLRRPAGPTEFALIHGAASLHFRRDVPSNRSSIQY
jgi:hypothetical protein